MVRKNSKDNTCKTSIEGIADESHVQEREKQPSILRNSSNKEVNEKKSNLNELKSVSFVTLFRHSDGLDKMLLFSGLLSGLFLGSMWPTLIVITGHMTDVFVKQALDSILRDDIVKNATLLFNLSKNTSPKEIVHILNVTQHVNASQKLSELLESDFTGAVQQYSIQIMLVGFGILVSAYIAMACFATSSHRQTRRIRRLLLWSILRQDISWFDAYEPAELNTRLADDIGKIQNGMGEKLALIDCYLSTGLAGVIISLYYGWKLTLVMLAASPLLFISGAILAMVSSTLSKKELLAYAKAGAVAQEVFSCIRTVIAFSGQEREKNRYDTRLKEAFAVGVIKGYLNGTCMGFVYLFVYSVQALALWYGSQLVFSTEMSPGNMLIVYFNIFFASFWVGLAASTWQCLTMAQGAAYEIYKIIDLQPTINGTSDKGDKPSSLEGTIEYRNITFRYPTRENVPVLQDFNLTVNVGQTIALVGSSGCGKSTVVQLLQRFYDPLEGEVLIDGHNIKNLNVQWLRRRIGVVSQEPVLFATSIAENISYGLEGATQEEIEAAAKEAYAHDFIKMLPNGYDTLVGERGVQLSGGQKQRIAIARAIVSNPKILILDEATSALDAISEALVQKALDKVRKGRTTFIIAHRLSTIRTADIIAGIKNGLIVEKGTHEELMKVNGVYYQLVTQQTIAGDDENSFIVNKGSTLNVPIENTESSDSSYNNDVKKKQMISESSIENQPSVKIEQETQQIDVKLWDIIKLNSPEWIFILLGCIGSAVFGCNQLVFAFLFSDIIGVFGLERENAQKEINTYCIVMIFNGVVSGIAMFLLTAMFTRSGEGLTLRLRQMAFKTYLRQDVTYFDDPRNTTGALCVRLSTDASAVQGATGRRIGLVLQTIVNIIASIVVGMYFAWKLTLILLLSAPILALGGYIEDRILLSSSANNVVFEEAGKIATDCIQNIRTVAALTKEKMFCENYCNLLETPYRRELRHAHVFAAVYGLARATYDWGFAAGFIAGAYFIQNGGMTYEDVFKSLMIMNFGAVYVGQAFAYIQDFNKAKMAANRLFALFLRQPKIDNNSTEGIPPTHYNGQVEMNQVHFSYESRPDVPVLRGLNLLGKPTKRVALVGSSGCGKSTVMQLIERFYDPISGNVAFDNANARNLHIQWLRSQLSIVSQEPTLFDSTIRENIEYGDNSRKVTIDEVVAAAKTANIHTFITSLPKGYETEVGERGCMLSGGQKQRVAIARALIRNPKLLLLDEATSALDTESEKIVQEALDEAQKGRTCIVIAHRLSTIYHADCIVVLQHGKVAEMGTHSELLAMKGRYYALHNSQLGTVTTS